MHVYSIVELILLIFLIIHKWFLNNQSILNLLTFLPIFFTALYMFVSKKKIEKPDKLLYLALLIAVVGDIFLIYINNVYGIYSFLLIQLIYFYYFNNSKVKISYLIYIAILVLITCLLLDKKSLVIEGILYFVIFARNIYSTLNYQKHTKKTLLILIGFICLAVCDTNVLIVSIVQEYNIFPLLEKICFTIEWIAYISFQVFISYAITKIKKN